MNISIPSDREDWVAMFAGRISFPELVEGLKRQGQFGSDVLAPHEALYPCMRECGNGADEPKSPTPFSNEIRAAINYDR